MVKIATALVAIILSGCMPEVVYRDRIKEVPILVFGEPPVATKVERQVLPIDELKHDDSDQATAEAYVKSVLILKSENEQLRAAKQPFDKDSE